MSSRKPYVGGNWKCNGTMESVKSLISGLSDIKQPETVDVMVSPSFVHLSAVGSIIDQNHSTIILASQGCSAFGNGAFTGSTSCDMLIDMKVRSVILGHSERRHVFHEDDEIIGKKVQVAMEKGLHVVGCIGEKIDERKAEKTLEVCFRQLEAITKKITKWDNFVLAYEPVWAIGTGLTATNEQAQEVHLALRKWIGDHYSPEIANKVRIIYGGSVKPSNAAGLMTQPDVDGFLVGGASLKVKDFQDIINSAK